MLFAIESVGVVGIMFCTHTFKKYKDLFKCLIHMYFLQIISIEAKMKFPKDYLGLYGLLNMGLGTSLMLYALVAFFGYWRYGERVKDSITSNLPMDEL